MKLSIAMLATLSSLMAFSADTWYVKPDGTDAEGRGTSAETPWRTLQYAHDKAAAGDTILLLPGTYAEGEVADPKHKNRLVVSKKLFFRATGKKSEAIVEGQLDPSTGKWGANGIRCVYVTADGYDSEFHGITFKEGGGGDGGDENGSSGWGGCVHVYGGKSASKTANVFRAFFVDCDFIDGCGKWGGGLNGGTAIRCFFSGNRGSSFGASASGSALWNCVIVNGLQDASSSDPRPQVGNYSLVVNSVIYGCEQVGIDRACKVYNSYCANMSSREFSTKHETSYIVYTNSVCGSGALNTSSGKQAGQYFLVSPATGDYRPRAGTELIGGGLTSHLTDIIKLPSDMVWKDFNGNDIDLTKETCDVGAVQGGVETGTGILIFPAEATVNGFYNLRAAHSFAESFPAWASYVSGKGDYFRTRLAGFVGSSSFRYPNRDGRIWLGYPPFENDVTELTEDVVALELWTDPTADAATADGSAEHPYRTLQAAVDAASGNTIIHALPGEYAEGETFQDGATNRVVVADKAIILRSTCGAAETTIRGAAAPLENQPYSEGYPGCGEGAIRAISFQGTSNRLIEGFTIADGHSRCVEYTADVASDRGGGANFSSSDGRSVRFVDCVFTNCTSVRSTMYGGWYDRCRFYDCQGCGGVTRYANLSASYVDPSCKVGKGAPGASVNGVVGTGTRAYQCTCPTAGHANVNEPPRLFVNLIFCKLAPYSSSTSAYRYWGTLLSPDYVKDNYSADTAEFCFVDEAAGDYRLLANTPTTVGGKMPERGTEDYGLWASNYAGYVTLGLDQKPIRLRADGCPMPGCWQEPVEGLWVSSHVNGGLAVDGGKLGANLVEGSGVESVTVRFTTDAKRPLSAYVLNGVTNDVPANGRLTLTKADVAAAGGLCLAPAYAPHWYVDAENGDDAKSGFTAATAKKTLKAVLGDKRVASGDTVHAAEGTYATDSMAYEITDKNTTMKADSPVKKLNMYVRAIVPAGVTLQADGRADRTVIAGSLDADATSSRHSLGSNAVHCVYLSGVGSTIRGFTVTGGGTDWYDTAIYANDWVLPIGGGGILGHQGGRDNVYAYDCIISNNWGSTASGARFVNLIRCRLEDNYAHNTGGHAREINAVGTVFGRAWSGGTAALYDFTRLESCTLGAESLLLSGGTLPCIATGSSGIASLTNCLILGTCGVKGAMTNMVFNTVFARGSNNFPLLDNCFVDTDGSQVQVDADLRPVPGQNPAVDRGDRTHVHARLPMDFDALGVPRVMNGEIDVGALEADWRPVYARDVAKSGKFAVTEVSPDVVESADKTVAIPEGETVTAVWRNTSGRTLTYTLSVKVPAAGTLTVYLNGEKLRDVTAEGTTDLTFEGPLAENVLAFDYAGAGAAELLNSRCEIGTLLIIR